MIGGRKQSGGDCYHIMVRGVGRMNIFEDDLDRKKLHGLIARNLEASRERPPGVQLLAWCFMDNHVHFLVRGSMEMISKFMHDTLAPYARWFNFRHDRVGTMFQGRFKSRPILDDAQLLAVMRYIHRNPVEQGQLLRCEWSSYKEYIDDEELIDSETILHMLGGKEAFVHFNALVDSNGEADGNGLSELEDRHQLLERELYGAAYRICSPYSPNELTAMERKQRNLYLRRLKEAGFNARQIERLTGIGRNIIQRS